MARTSYRTLEHSYKGFFIWGTGENWNVEPECFDPDGETSLKFWEVRNAQPHMKTLREAKKWIKEHGEKLVEELKNQKAD